MAGLTGIGLLCAVVLGASLAWIGPVAYLLVGVYALYTDWWRSRSAEHGNPQVTNTAV